MDNPLPNYGTGYYLGRIAAVGAIGLGFVVMYLGGATPVANCLEEYVMGTSTCVLDAPHPQIEPRYQLQQNK